MKKSKVKVSIEGEIFNLKEAAELLGEPRLVVNNLLNRHKVFSWKGFKEIKRVDIPNPRKGTIIKRLSDNKGWNSIKALSDEMGFDPNDVAVAIRNTQQFVYNGETYTAPYYVKRTRTLVNPMKKHDITIVEENKQRKSNDIKAINKEVITVEADAIEALKKLATDRINKALYDKASLVIQALELLTKT